MGILDKILGRKTKQGALTAMLPAIVNNLFAQTQGEGFENIISMWESGSRVRVKRSKENMCELTAAVLSVQANQWFNRITPKHIAEQCVHEAIVMLSSTTCYTYNVYNERISIYRKQMASHADPRPFIAGQLFFMLEPEEESMEAWKALGEHLKSGESGLIMQATILFAHILDILKLHEPFIDHVNSAA